MKRLLIFLLVIMVVVIIFYNKEENLFNYKNITNICVISKQEEPYNNEEVIKNGEQYLHIINKQDVKNINDYDDIEGIVLYIEDTDIKNIISHYDIDCYKGSSVEGYEIYYGYTPKYSTFNYVQGRKINAQIAMKGQYCIIGFPMILTGF